LNFKVKVCTEKHTIKLNQKSARILNVEKLHATVARFGFKVTEVKIKIDTEVAKNVIYISDNIFKNLNLPKNNQYLVHVVDKEVIFGPYLGIYLGEGEKNYKWKYERLASFVSDFSEINGAVCAFTAKDINFSKMQINAFYYDSFKNIWRQKVMPFPSVIHIYGGMKNSMKQLLRGIYGNNLFNYNEMDKWTEMTVLQSHSNTAKYIPNTVICENEKVFKKFVLKHNDVYFKPIKGRQGKGIHRIKKLSNKEFLVIIQSAKDHKEVIFNTIDDVIEKLENHINSTNYILQKTINISINQRVIDFRIRFEKNIENRWVLSLFAARISDPGGVVSNRSAGGSVVSADEALRKYYNFSKRKAEKIKLKLINAGLEITKVVEENNVNYGKCAVDLGLDTDGKVWHIESNVKAPNDGTTMAFEKYKGLDRVCHMNMLYSKRLSGFKNVKNNFELIRSEKEEIDDQNKKEYNLYITGRFKKEHFEDIVINEFIKNDIEIIKKSIRNTFILIKIKINEKQLLELVSDIRKLDKTNLMRTVLYYEKELINYFV